MRKLKVKETQQKFTQLFLLEKLKLASIKMSEDANENSDYYNPVFMDVGNESGNTSVAKQSANKQKPETAMTKNKQYRWNVCLLVAVAILFCLVLVLLELVAYFIIVSRYLMSNVRSLEN